MPDRIFHVRLILLLSVAVYTALICVQPLLPDTTNLSNRQLSVHFLDVGQGDAILIITPEGDQILIDGGPGLDVLQALAQRLPFTDRTIEVVLGTHPDLDHVTGLVGVLEQYHVPTIITTEATGTSPEAQAWEAAVRTEGARVYYGRAGAVYQLGVSTTLTILSPSYDPRKLNSNAGSIVALLRYGEVQFLLTGDAPQGVEQYLADTYGETLAATVLKLGHHGSDTSSHPDFLQVVNPDYAVVSAGVDNRYNHPDPDVLGRVANYTDAQIVSTQHGTVSFVTDGSTVELVE